MYELHFRAILLLTSFVSLSFVPFATGKMDTSFQNSAHFHSSFPTTQNQNRLEFNSKVSPVYDGSTSKVVKEGRHYQSNHLLGTPETAQAVVAVVQAVNRNQQQNHQSSPETIRSNSNNLMGMNRRCTYFENGEMRCTSRGDALDNLSSLINQAVSLVSQLGGLSGLASQLGGLTGLMGLLGLKGIAGLILPLLCLFLLKFWLILLPLKLLIPIPIITLPFGAGRRNLQNMGYAHTEEKIASAFKQFITSDGNIDKIVPKVTKTTKKEKLKGTMKIKHPNYKKSTYDSKKSHKV